VALASRERSTLRIIGGLMIRFRRTLACVLLATTLGVPYAAAGDPPDSFPHIRSRSGILLHLIEDASSRSEAFRTLVETLSASDVVVYVEYDAGLRHGLAGRMTFISDAGGFRYVRIGVSQHYAGCDLQAILAHELQHAVEIAKAVDVVDERTMAALYDRIGYGVSEFGRRWYETRMAQDVARRVQRELLEWTPLTRRSQN
jgi:hypothetical protein